MKKVLILVVSSLDFPYKKMWQTQRETWDIFEFIGVETVFYFSRINEKNTNKEIYFPYQETYSTMGRKLLDALQWALDNKEFDYVCRVNSSTFVDKKQLLNYVQTLPNENLVAGLEVKVPEGQERWLWGFSYILSKDVVQKIVDNRDHYDHTKMDDVGISYLINKIGISYYPLKACSIDKMPEGWRMICYGGEESYLFNDFSEIKKEQCQSLYRVKHDLDRDVDAYVMGELFKVLQ